MTNTSPCHVSRWAVALIVLAISVAGCGAPVEAGRAEPAAALSVEVAWLPSDGSGALRCPTGLAVERDGTLIVVDAGNDRLVRLAATGPVLNQWGRDGVASRGFLFAYPPDHDLGAACLVGGQVAVDADGTLVVADLVSVQRLDRDGRVVVTLVATRPDDGRPMRPVGIAIDHETGHVYVADSVDARIHKYDRNGQWLLAWGGRGQGPESLTNPAAVAVDTQGRVYVADRGSHRLLRFDSDGRYLTVWGGMGLAAGEFIGPKVVAVDKASRVYVVDAERVQVFADTGVLLAAWPVGTGSPAAPGGIAVDAHGSVYVTDIVRGRVLHYRLRGSWPVVAGMPTPRPTPTPATPGPPTPPTATAVVTPADR
jgi:DNA-binding beta-propeller fold protein YncE